MFAADQSTLKTFVPSPLAQPASALSGHLATKPCSRVRCLNLIIYRVNFLMSRCACLSALHFAWPLVATGSVIWLVAWNFRLLAPLASCAAESGLWSWVRRVFRRIGRCARRCASPGMCARTRASLRSRQSHFQSAIPNTFASLSTTAQAHVIIVRAY
jgi:hypothetical protein